VERSVVISCLGAPIATDHHTVSGVEILSDTYVYKDGGAKNAAWSKAGRAVLYTAGDVFTIFLTQLIWIPTEKFMLEATKFGASVDYARANDGKWHIRQATQSRVQN